MILMYTFKFGLGKDLLNILQDLELKAKSGDDLLQECGKLWKVFKFFISYNVHKNRNGFEETAYIFNFLKGKVSFCN